MERGTKMVIEQFSTGTQSMTPEEMYQRGQSCNSARNYEDAAKWYRSAAERGHPGAQLNLGFAYESGLGIGKNPAEAVRWFREAADHGYAPAQSRMAYCYEHGFGVERNLMEAISWADKAGDQGIELGRRQGRQLREKLWKEGGVPSWAESKQDFNLSADVLLAYHGSGADVLVPSDIKRIGAGAFENNCTIQSIILPEGVIGISARAFRGCTAFAGS